MGPGEESAGCNYERGCRCHCAPLEQAHRLRSRRVTPFTRSYVSLDLEGLDYSRGIPSGAPAPRPLLAPGQARARRSRARRAGSAGATANERRLAADSEGRQEGGLRARARAAGLTPQGARSARATQRAREQEQVWWVRSGGARPRAAPPSAPLPPPRPPASRVPHLHVAGARECARAGGDGVCAWEGAGARGPCPSEARARARRPRPSERTPAAPPPPRRARALGEQRDGLGPQGGSHSCLRARRSRAVNNPTHPQQRRNVFPSTKYPAGDPIKDSYRKDEERENGCSFP